MSFEGYEELEPRHSRFVGIIGTHTNHAKESVHVGSSEGHVTEAVLSSWHASADALVGVARALLTSYRARVGEGLVGLASLGLRISESSRAVL